MADAFSIFILVCAVAGLGYILWAIRTGNQDRRDEDAARDFYERHGHWPDQTLEEAEAERRQTASVVPVSTADGDGLV